MGKVWLQAEAEVKQHAPPSCYWAVQLEAFLMVHFMTVFPKAFYNHMRYYGSSSEDDSSIRELSQPL